VRHSAEKIVSLLNKNDFKALFAGGYVRDQLLCIENSKDIDIVTNAKPDDIKKIFTKTISEVSEKFGVIFVIMDGYSFDVATFRKDIYSNNIDGRHPNSVMLSSTMKEDSNRRDFTINSIFYDPIKNKYIDLNNGIKDLELKIIRFVGDPKQRIFEDKLRMLRAIRFASKLSFTIEKNTFREIQKNAHEINCVSSERIEKEFSEIKRIS
jgi:poly(A) polymerase